MMGFLHVETREIDEAEWERLQSPYAQQVALLDLLTLAWNHNAEILTRYGYRVPKGDALYPWAGTPMTQSILEPDAIEAFRVIQAICDLWRAIWSKDVFAIANAAHWLGRMTAGDQFRKYNARNARKKRKPRPGPKSRARAFYETREDWPDDKVFIQALCEADEDIRKNGKSDTVYRWFKSFEEEKADRA